MTDPHSRGTSYVRRIGRAMRRMLTNETTTDRVAGGKASRQGVFSSKQTFTGVDDDGVEHVHEVWVALACGCGRLLDQNCPAQGTCATCKEVVCAACARACFTCGATLCTRHARRFDPGGEKAEVYLCSAHAWKALLWTFFGGGP